VTGVTVIKMNEKMDEGDIILKREIAIEARDTNITLTTKNSRISGRRLLPKAIEVIKKK